MKRGGYGCDVRRVKPQWLPKGRNGCCGAP